jgi:isopentenyl-diphosphate delta-isomerase
MAFEQNNVIVVNERDEWLGVMEKMAAHREGVLHRAVSVFILNNKNELLLQQRAAEKYHSGGLWTNTCCSHPLPGESTLAAAHRRLKQEMGFDTNLEPIFTLRYKADVGDGLTENEYDHMFVGRYNDAPLLNPEEAMAYQYLPIDAVAQWLKEKPQEFTAWFHLAFPMFVNHLQQVNASL